MPEYEFGSDGQLHAAEASETVDIFAASEPAAQRIRAFEDEHLGPDVVRINGEVEKGHGSLFKTLSPDKHRVYAALQRLHVAEAGLTAAESNLAVAQSDHAAATADVEAAAQATAVRSESEKGG